MSKRFRPSNDDEDQDENPASAQDQLPNVTSPVDRVFGVEFPAVSNHKRKYFKL
jgi:hypothetical protein